jgi:hypothetical protein
MLTYSQQPEYRRVVRRRRHAREKAQLHAIRAAVRRKPVMCGPRVPKHTGLWSVADETHALRLHAFGAAIEDIALVIQRPRSSVERRLLQFRKGRQRQKYQPKDSLGRFCRAAEAAP